MDIDTLVARFAEADAAFEQKRFFDARDLRRSLQGEVEKATSLRQHGRTINENCRASVIILSHIDDDLIGDALSRVASQVGEGFEVILVSNGNANLEKRGQDALENFSFIDIPLNSGCGMGRNIAATHAKGDWLIFLEDDGLIEPGCIDALLRCVDETGAVMVRGKYQSLTGNPQNDPPHYDLGDYRRYAFLNCEGVSCVSRKDYLLFDGFDPVLVGHEGVELCARMWRFYGPRGFMYEPKAVMLHDYTASSDPAQIGAKLQRQAGYKAYVDEVTPDAMELYKSLLATSSLPTIDAALLALEAKYSARESATNWPKISVLTTAKDGEDWLDDFVLSWSRQNYENFEVIFVDDGSKDNTYDVMRKVSEGDSRFVVIKGDGGGRSAALNTAIENATGEILAIADVDDVSTVDRLELTAKYFLTHPDVELLSFTVFGEKFMNWIGGRPSDKRFGDLETRGLLGMPGRFPTFAFRKEFTRVPFPTHLNAGVDYDWAVRNMAVAPLASGRSIPVPVTYYRQHERSITNNRKAEQDSVRDATIKFNFERLIGPLSEKDGVFIEALSRMKMSDPRFDKTEYQTWVAHLLRLNQTKKCFDTRALEYTLMQGLIVGNTSGNFQASGDPFEISRGVMSNVLKARADGDSKLMLRILRRFRAGARGVILESIYAEAAHIWRRFLSGSEKIDRKMRFR